MRDKVLCKGWAETRVPSVKGTSFLLENSYFIVLQSFFTLFLPNSVPVSVREGEKMSIEEVLSFFDGNAAWKNQEAQRGFLEQVSRQGLDTIVAAESLFKGTVVDFDLLHSGGGNYGQYSCTIS